MSHTRPPADFTYESILDEFGNARNWWVSTSGPGGPHASPTWGVAHDGALWLFGPPTAIRSKNLLRDKSVVIHSEGADAPLIVHGEATCAGPVGRHPSVTALYREKYTGEVDVEFLPELPIYDGAVFFRIAPVRAMSWRMAPRKDWTIHRWKA